MLSTIHFDDEAKGRAVEIEDVWPKLVLPANLGSCPMTVTEEVPHATFRICAPHPQVSRQREFFNGPSVVTITWR